MPGVRSELQKIERMPRWRRRQNDDWDRLSRFIYHIKDLDALREATRSVARENGLSPHDFGCYVLHRWYNFHTHQVVLDIILAHPDTRPEPDRYHHTIDFYLNDEGFDLKLTRLPDGFDGDISEALAHPGALARWLYANQSRQGRFHAANRLFVVLHDAEEPGRTWKLRRDFAQIEKAVRAFLDEPRLLEIEVRDPRGERHRPKSGVAFYVRGDC